MHLSTRGVSQGGVPSSGFGIFLAALGCQILKRGLDEKESCLLIVKKEGENQPALDESQFC